jgi:hypothetical protein
MRTQLLPSAGEAANRAFLITFRIVMRLRRCVGLGEAALEHDHQLLRESREGSLPSRTGTSIRIVNRDLQDATIERG